MLYVNNQDEAVKFWTEKVGFNVISEEDNGQGMRWIEIAPTKEVETSIILHNKELIAKMQPELTLATPSLMFFSENLDKLHNDLSNKNIKVGEIVNMPSGRVFNFADSEDNYFAVMEKSKL
jgi:lactoylglutathione lyase